MTPRRLDTALLADLDAGLLDPVHAAAVRAAASADPHARAVLDALATTRTRLAALDDDPPVPPALADRWTAALRAELDAVATHGGPEPDRLSSSTRSEHVARPARPRAIPGQSTTSAGTTHRPSGPSAGPPSAVPRTGHTARPAGPSVSAGTSVRRPGTTPPRAPAPRRGLVGSGDSRSPEAGPPLTIRRGGRRRYRRRAVAAVLVLVALLGAGWLLTSAEAPAPLVVGRPQLVALGRVTVGVRDAGGLDDPLRRAGCLRAVAPPGVEATAPLLGARRVTFAGQPGVLLVLGTGQRGAFDIVVVDPGCGAGGGTRLAVVHAGPP